MEKGLELVNRFGKPIQVGLEISQYVNNGCIYIGLVIFEDGHPEPYANLTVNLREGAPDFCGYIVSNGSLAHKNGSSLDINGDGVINNRDAAEIAKRAE